METREALEDVRYLKSLITQARGSLKNSAEYLVIWGFVWLVGYLARAAGLPDRLQLPAWLVLIAAGAAVSAPHEVRRRRRGCPMPLLSRLWLWSGLAVVVNGLAVILLAQVMGLLRLTDLSFWWYFPLLWVGSWYALGGLIMGRGMALLGAWLVLLGLGTPLAGLQAQIASAVLGVLGGGALIVTGLLARRGGSDV